MVVAAAAAAVEVGVVVAAASCWGFAVVAAAAAASPEGLPWGSGSSLFTEYKKWNRSLKFVYISRDTHHTRVP